MSRVLPKCEKCSDEISETSSYVCNAYINIRTKRSLIEMWSCVRVFFTWPGRYSLAHKRGMRSVGRWGAASGE